MSSTAKRRPKIHPADRADYEMWVDSQIARCSEMNGLKIDILDTFKMRRAGVSIHPTEVWRGPRWATETYWTTEFRELVDEGVIPRITISEWAERANRARESDELESEQREQRAELDQLEWMRDAMAERDALIVAARAKGATVPELCESTGLGRSQVHKILKDRRDAEQAAEWAAADAAAEAEAMAAVYESWADDDGEPF